MWKWESVFVKRQFTSGLVKLWKSFYLRSIYYSKFDIVRIFTIKKGKIWFYKQDCFTLSKRKSNMNITNKNQTSVFWCAFEIPLSTSKNYSGKWSKARSSCSQVVYKMVVLKKLKIVFGKYPWPSFFFRKAASCIPVRLLNVFFRKIVQFYNTGIFKNTSSSYFWTLILFGVY